MKPKTLQQAIKHFSNEQTCIDTVAALKWPDGKPVCPACGHKEHYYLASQKRWKCKECWKQFSVKLGTIFEDSPIGLDKWLAAMWMLANCRNGVSSYEIARAVGVTQKSAWFMMHRLRLALQDGSTLKLGGDGGEVEADETFIGGKARNMHKSVRARKITQGSKAHQTIVMGVLERGGNVRTQVVSQRNRATVQKVVKQNVKAGSALFTDEHHGYWGLAPEYKHQIVEHAVKYVDGRVHTNAMENFWSLLKRGLHGTYVSVEPFHLFRYLDEQCFRFNNRKDENKKPVSDHERFTRALTHVAGKRLTYAELTDKKIQAETF
jgi:transposase-like protein